MSQDTPDPVPQKPFYTRKRFLGLIIPVVLLGLAIHILHKHLAGMTWVQLRDAFGNIDHNRIHLSVLATIISFLGLAAYDVFAVRVAARGRMPLWSAAFAGLTGSAVSNTMGFHILTGGAVRYRIFKRWDLSLGDISRITALSMAGIGLGYIALITVALFFKPFGPSFFPDWMNVAAPYAGIALLIGEAFFLWWLSGGNRRVVIHRWVVPFPNATSAWQQMVVGFFEMGAAMMALYVLVPSDLLPSLAGFSMIYIGAIFLGILSHAPGGVGVFEAGIMVSLAAKGRADMVAALLVYRAIYNLAPFVLGVIALALRELWHMVFSSKADSAG
jgi:uncharacterized membrane protein YbhN (UPF0104 family)